MANIGLIVQILSVVIELIKLIGHRKTLEELKKLHKTCDEQCKSELMDQAHRNGSEPI